MKLACALVSCLDALANGRSHAATQPLRCEFEVFESVSCSARMMDQITLRSFHLEAAGVFSCRRTDPAASLTALHVVVSALKLARITS